MARAGCRTNGLQKLECDDVEKSLELLDKVLSEFEDPDSLPHIEPESPSQGNQSEDDGYMSMNGRRAKIPPDFQQPSDELPISPPVMAPLPVIPIETDGVKSSPPPPEVADVIISNLLPRVSPTITTANEIVDNNFGNDDAADRIINKIKLNRLIHQKNQHPTSPQDGILATSPLPASPNYITNYVFKGVNGNDKCHNGGQNDEEKIKKGNDSMPESNVTQTTLPKTRPSTVIPSRYSSLPCSGPARSFGSFDGIGGMRGMSSGSFDGGRNVLGIGISAVHDAVLRGGVARLPEPIVNEHPVTIYPGRASPPRTRVPPRTLPGSIERHREVCRNLNINSDTDVEKDPNFDIQLMSPLQRLAITKSPSSPIVVVQPSFLQNGINNSYSSNQLIDNNKNKHLINNFIIPPRKRGITTNPEDDGKKNHLCCRNNSNTESSEEFSDDSLEGQSLPPPPAPPVVPPPPSLSAPVTPSKRGSIAWEINLDDSLPPPPPQQNLITSSSSSKKKKTKEKQSSKLETSSNKQFTRRRGHSMSGSQSSLTSTPGNSGGSLSNNHSPVHNHRHHYHHHHHHQYHTNSNPQLSSSHRHRSGSVEWPEPPDPPVCSTEDEAASLHSDSDEIVPPIYPLNMTGNGTYVIRKGRKERQRLSDLNNSMSSSINSRLSSEGNLTGITQQQSQQSPKQNNSLFIPNSRHSIDLGSSSLNHHYSPSSGVSIQPNTILSPRSRLSLDLSSPNSTSELPHIIRTTTSLSTTNLSQNNGITSGTQQQQQSNISPHYAEFLVYNTTTNFDGLPVHESNGKNNGNGQVLLCTASNNNLSTNNNSSNGNVNGSSLTRVSSLPAMSQQSGQIDVISTPRRELAPPIEEDEEQDSESQRGAPLRQIENNISALLRGDIAVARVGDISLARRPLGFRPGVHKSESAKEMLLSQQTTFGPLPPSPPTTSPELENDGFPPLPPSPPEDIADDEAEDDILRGLHGVRLNCRTRHKTDQFTRDLIDHPPAVPPHRGPPSMNTLKTRSMDAGYSKKFSSSNSTLGTSVSGPGTLPGDMPMTSSRRRLMSGAFPKRSAQSPREERRLQTSCSLPETPIFARGCDIPRTPHRRAPEIPSSGARTAPRTNTATTPILNSSIVGIGSTLGGGRQRSVSQALASGEMLRLAGGPARGWYPKQRTLRPASTEHLDRLHRSQGSIRAWDSGGMMMQPPGCTGGRKPLTLPPNITPKFFNKSPREALRRVTSLLIRKGNGKDKESKKDKEAFVTSAVHRSPGSAGDIPAGQTPTVSTTTPQQKKKGFFKSFWKKSKHYSLDQ